MILHVASQIYSKTEQPKNDHFQKISKESRFRLEEYSKLNSSAENTLLSIFRQQSFLNSSNNCDNSYLTPQCQTSGLNPRVHIDVLNAIFYYDDCK